MILPVTDLNLSRRICDPVMESIAGADDVRGQAGVCANHGASAASHLSPNRYSLFGRTEGQVVLLSGSVLEHGIRAADIPREPARYRGVFASAAFQALSPRD